MFKGLLSDDTAPPIGVGEDPDVQRLAAERKTAMNELANAEAKLRRLLAVLDGTAPADELRFFEAKIVLPDARLRLQKAQAAAAKLSGQLQMAKEAAVQRLDTARAQGRKPLIREMFDRFLDAVEATERLQAFDADTQAMGGSASALPCPGLIKSVYEFQKTLAEKDDLL